MKMRYRSKVYSGVFFLLISVCGCHSSIKKEPVVNRVWSDPVLESSEITHDTKFKVVKVMTTIEHFNDLGFVLGDSVDATFSTGYTLTDIPYYNGFYIKQGDAMIVGYPGRSYLYLGYNDSDDIWELANLDEKSTVTVKLHERGKYRTVQETFQLVYTDERRKYASDIEFANYRAMTGGRIKENVFFRSASPCDNQHKRAPYVDALMKADQIQYVINFSDNEQSVDAHLNQEGFNSPYFRELYQNGRVSLLDLSSNYRLSVFKERVAQSLIKLLSFDAPYLAHCVEGKDRTGFISILMEGLCGASYDEMKDDYMKTYEIYYHVSKTHKAESYEAISALLYDAMVGYLAGTNEIEALKSTDFSSYVMQYLIDGGMTQAQIEALSDRICD